MNPGTELLGLVLFLLLQFSFLLGGEQGLLLGLPLTFVFTSLVTHIGFSVIEKKTAAGPRQASLTCSAQGPLGPRPSV